MSSPLHHHRGDTLQEKCPSLLIVHICGLDFKSMLPNAKELLQQNCATVYATYSTRNMTFSKYITLFRCNKRALDFFRPLNNDKKIQEICFTVCARKQALKASHIRDALNGDKSTLLTR